MQKILFASLLLILYAGSSVMAQSCRGSYATYIVRDAKGKVITNPASSSVTYTGGESIASKKWRYSIQGEFVNAGIKLPAALAAIANNVSGITTSQFCNFPEPALLNVTLGGKTMELTFKFPKMGEQDSADFVVDSLPFKPGKYAITLAKATGYGMYYAPTGWKKLP